MLFMFCNAPCRCTPVLSFSSNGRLSHVSECFVPISRSVCEAIAMFPTTAGIVNTLVRKLLLEIAISEKFQDYEILEDEQNNEGNYLGILHKVVIRGKCDDSMKKIHLVIKTAPERMRKYFPLHEMYSNEIFIYEELSKIYEDLQDGLPADEKYKFVKCYSSSNLRETVVLENMSFKNYMVQDRFQCINQDYACKAITNLARFHGLSYVLQRKNPEFFNGVIKLKKGNMFLDYNGPERFRNKVDIITECSVNNLVNADYRKKVEAFCKNMCTNVEKYVKRNRHAVLCHGDYKGNNLLVKYENGDLNSMVAIDYQMIHYGSPINDLLYFIFVTTDSTFRRQHLVSLTRHYRNALRTLLQHFSLHLEDVYPEKEFEDDVKSHMLLGMVVAVQVLPYILVSADQTPDLKNPNESAYQKAMRCPNETFLERYNGIVDDFVLGGYL